MDPGTVRLPRRAEGVGDLDPRSALVRVQQEYVGRRPGDLGRRPGAEPLELGRGARDAELAALVDVRVDALPHRHRDDLVDRGVHGALLLDGALPTVGAL